MSVTLPQRWSIGPRLALLAGVLLTGASVLVSSQVARARDHDKAPELKLRLEDQAPGREQSVKTSFAPVVREVATSVVSIQTKTRAREMEGRVSPFGGNPFFREFFGESGPGGPMMTPPRDGLGSGVIVTEDGYILTNNHVIDGADEVEVILNPDGRRYDAKVVGRDPKSDIAVLKIEAEALVPVRVGNSDLVEVGDMVLALGNPFGVGQTVTMGIVGATSRAVLGQMGQLEYEDFIQTDAAINPGNSGGALLDVEGRLIGINTAILSRGGGNNGIGFAVPVNLARSVLESIVAHGRVVRGYMGVNIQGVTPELATEFGLKDARGALVAEVNPRSPADKAGMQSGDVIVQFDGRDVRDNRHLMLLVGQTPPDRKVEVSVLRDGRPRQLQVELDERPENPRLASSGRGGASRNAADVGGLQGVVVSDLTPALARQYEIPAEMTGALITEVTRDSAAWEANLRPGDLIREINRVPVQDAESAIEAVQKLENARILLRVWREGANRFVVVDESRQKR